MSIKALIFDLDGVLTETSEEHYRAWKIIADEMGMDFDREFNENLKGISRLESLERILLHCGREKDFSEIEKINIANRKNKIYREMIKDITPKDLFPKILPLLKKLRLLKIKIAIGSASKNAPTIVNGLGIEEYIDYIVNPNEVKLGKPAPDIFLRAAEALGVKPSECVGIEDSESGIQAIKSAGMFAVGVGTKDKMKRADIVFESPKELDLDKIIEAYNR